jgi:hypothetical protein
MRPIEAAINAVAKPIPGAAPTPGSDLPYATHTGELELVPGLILQVARLSDGRAVILAESMERFLAWLSGELTEKETVNV